MGTKIERGTATTQMGISLCVSVQVLPATRSGSAESRTTGCIGDAADGRFFHANAGSRARLSN